MKKIYTNVVKLMLLLAVVLCADVAKADNVFSIAPVTISNYDVVNIPVELDNTDAVGAFSFDVVLPDELEMEEPTKNTDRLVNGHQLKYNPVDHRVLVFSANKQPIKGNSGAVVYLPVKVKDGMLTNTTVKLGLTNIDLSAGNGSQMWYPDDFEVDLTLESEAYKYSAYTVEKQIVVYPGATQKITVGINNNGPIRSFQLDVVLPAGLTVDVDDVVLSNRCTNEAIMAITPRSDGVTTNFVFYAFSKEDIVKNDASTGDIFTFTVKAADDYAVETGEMVIKNFRVSYSSGKDTPAEGCKVTIINGVVAYDKAMAVVAGLETALQDALAKIADTCPDVKDNFTGADITKQIQDLRGAVDAAYADGSLNSNYDAVMAPADAISAAIDKLESDADAAEKQFLADQAAAANTQAHERMTSKLNDARQSLTDMLATIKKECPDVADQFPGTDISDEIAAIKAQLEESKTNGTCVADEKAITDKINALDEEIAALKAAADAAEKQFQADEAAAANQAAYNRMNDLVNEANQSLTGTLEAIKKECSDVAEQFPGTDISGEIAVIKTELDACKENGTCVAKEKEITDKINALDEKIAALKAAADAAEKQFQADQAAANQAAYDRMNELVNKKSQSLAGTLEEIKKECPDVADQFPGTEISDEIAAIKAQLEESKTNGTCVADEKAITDKINALDEEIKALKTEASRLQEIYSYNKSAHAAVIKEIDALQAELEAMKALVAEKYPDASVAVNIYVAQEAINKARTDADDELSDANENGTKFDYSYDADSIKKQIKEIEIAAKATGISDVILDGAEGISAVYTIDGQKIPAPVYGMNIIVTTNGKVKKVYVK